MDAIIQFMLNPKAVNSFGLLLDIAGAVMIFLYGLPNRSAQQTQWGSDPNGTSLRSFYL